MAIENEDQAFEALRDSIHRIKSANKMDKLVQKEMLILAEVLGYLVGQESSSKSYNREMLERY